MTIEPEFYIVALVILTLTAAVRFRRDDFWRALAALTTIEQQSDTAMSDLRNLARYKSSVRNAPVLLKVPASAQASAAKPAPAAETVPADSRAGRDGATQLDRISQIVNGAIETAGRANRLHQAAHEQVDSAHYALQNLLDELSAVMTPGTLAKNTRNATVTPMTRAATSQPAITALAA